MTGHRLTRKELRRIRRAAHQLLESPDFFNEFLKTVHKLGLVGEQRNALVLLVVVASRVLERPLNVFVRGHSSAGKNWLVTRVLQLLPRSGLAEVTSASDQAWSYSGTDLRHRVLYIQERNEATGSVDPIRLLISEKKLVRKVTGFDHGKRITKTHVTHGPVAAISTTTKNRLQIDDETRHISIWVDESAEQTRAIVRAYTRNDDDVSQSERETWRTVQRLLTAKIGTKIAFPKWFDKITDHLFVGDLSVRRYFPAFVEACRTVCLIRSFQPGRRTSNHSMEVDFADFAITALIFDSVFIESLRLGKGVGEATRRELESITTATGKPVRAKDLARKLNISMDKAYAKLRYAAVAGVVRVVSKPERSNSKKYLAIPAPRFVPDPEKLFHELAFKKKANFVHPLTGEQVVYKTIK